MRSERESASGQPDDVAVGRLLSTCDAASYLGLSVSQIRELVFRRQIPVTRLGRRLLFDRLALSAWVEARTEPPRL